MLDQICTTAQVKRTRRGSVSQPTSWPKAVFRIPYWVLKIHFQTMATAAGATTMGRKKMARNVVRPRIFELSSTATSSARKMPTGTVRIQNRIVLPVAFQNSGFWNISI